MAMYFFYFRDEDGDLLKDTEGQEFADLAGSKKRRWLRPKKFLRKSYCAVSPCERAWPSRFLTKTTSWCCASHLRLERPGHPLRFDLLGLDG